MKLKILIFYFCLPYQTSQAIIFNGLVETGVSKNNFLCSSAHSDSVNCIAADANAKGFDFSQNHMLQLFNDQAYWLHQEAIQQQYVSQVLSYSGNDLQNKMTADGWGAMGSYCLIISTDPILTNVVIPSITAGADQEKVVVQLWYNGNQKLQLWSQDAAILSKNQPFSVLITTNTDALPGVSKTSENSSNSLRTSFLFDLHLQQKNRTESVYLAATQSPRSVKIQGI